MSDLISRQRVIKEIDRFIPVDPMMSDYTQGISVGLAIATRCIEEFSQENHDSSQGLVKDLISRQDAIEAVEDTDWYHQNKKGEMVHGANPSDHQAWYKAEDIYNVLESLPSAEPKTPSNGSITSINPENTHDRTTDGLISREEMLRTYQELCRNISCSECSGYFCDASTGDCLLEKWIHSLPSIEPETPSNGSITSMNTEKMHVRTMGDLISRQDAIRLAEQGQIQGFEWQFKKLCMLPSAEKAQLSGEDATSICKCPCEYREPCDYCHYDAYRGHGCPAEEGLRDERHD